MQLTKEQQNVVDVVMTDNSNRVIAVNSVAGSGKTATANAIFNAYNPRNGLYTAFNKAIVESGNNKFGHIIPCKTIHSFAYKYIHPRNVVELSYKDIKEKVSFQTKIDSITELNNYFCSKYVSLDDYIKSNKNIGTKNAEIMQKYFCMMNENTINPSFNYLLKKLHIMLEEGQIEIDKDMVLIDEAQDVNGVTLEIFKHIHSPKKIILGDRFQNIYSFMNTVNSFEELDDLITLKLTKSFRCTHPIADKVLRYGKRYLSYDFEFEGVDDTESDGTKVYLSRTNPKLVERMYYLIHDGERFNLIKKIDELFELPLVLDKVSNGEFVPFHNDLCNMFKTYKNMNGKVYKDSFYTFLTENIDDIALKTACKVCSFFLDKHINIQDFFELSKKYVDKTSNIILSTVHTYKGLESDTVYIEKDLNDTISIYKKHSEKGEITDADEENLNIFYVALSRAKFKLENNTTI